MPRGRFITLEGGEGAGKSTQARLLAERLRAAGVSVVETREPGGTPFAEAMRAVLLGRPSQGVDPIAEALAHFAARVDHVEHRIRPALEGGQWVVSDRFADSTTAYQGAAGADAARIREIARAALGRFAPDLTIVLDVEAPTGLERARDPNRYEAKGADFHRHVRSIFRAIAAAEPARCILIDATADVATVAARIAAAVRDRLGLAL